MLLSGVEKHQVREPAGNGALPRASSASGSIPIRGPKAPVRAGRGQIYGEGCLPGAMACTDECKQLTAGEPAGREQGCECPDGGVLLTLDGICCPCFTLATPVRKPGIQGGPWCSPGRQAWGGDQRVDLEEQWSLHSLARVEEAAAAISAPRSLWEWRSGAAIRVGHTGPQ